MLFLALPSLHPSTFLEMFFSITLSTGVNFTVLIIMVSASEDYEAIESSIITFSPEQTSATVSVTIVNDNVLEDVEQFTVEVVATGGQERVDVGDAANISILNDDCEETPVSTSLFINFSMSVSPYLSNSRNCGPPLYNLLCLRR